MDFVSFSCLLSTEQRLALIMFIAISVLYELGFISNFSKNDVPSIYLQCLSPQKIVLLMCLCGNLGLEFTENV